MTRKTQAVQGQCLPSCEAARPNCSGQMDPGGVSPQTSLHRCLTQLPDMALLPEFSLARIQDGI